MAAFKAGQIDKAQQLIQSNWLVEADNADACALLGAIYATRRDFAAALPLFTRAVELAPGKAQFHFNLGVAHAELLSLDAAIESYAKALALQPQHIHALSNLGDLLSRHDRADEARQHYEAIRALDPDTRGLNIRLAGIYFDLQDYGQAEDYFKLALQQAACDASGTNTQVAQIRWHYAHLLLLKKRFVEGWEGYEFRGKCADVIAVPHYPHRQPVWSGERLHGKTLLVFREQGLGDEIMFGSLIAQAATDVQRLIIVASPAMFRLWQSTFNSQNRATDKVHVFADWYPQPPLWDTPAAPDWLTTSGVDFQCPVGRLAFLLRPTVESFATPRISQTVEPALILKWQHRLANEAALADKHRVGLMWCANAMRHCFDGAQRSMRKSVPLHEFNHLNPRPAQLQLVSLANAEHAAQLVSPDAPHMLDFSKYLTDLAETAALIKNLDLIITVDTSLAHLAGALGLQVWLLLGHSADWRWGENDDTSYWYVNVRIFRQSRAGDWATVVKTVSAELACWADNRPTQAVG